MLYAMALDLIIGSLLHRIESIHELFTKIPPCEILLYDDG
jgi:hypothetical protein